MRDSARLCLSMVVGGANALIRDKGYERGEAFRTAWEIIKAAKACHYEGWAAEQALLESGTCPTCLSSEYLMPSDYFGYAIVDCLNCGSEWTDLWG